jgi:isocitrate dehydrogenase kinase/phosphatase
MLAALLVILFLGGGTSAFLEYVGETEHAIKTTIEKGERQDEALDILGAIEKRSNGYDKQVRETIKELSKYLEGRGDNAEMIAAISERHFAALESYNSDILDLRFELKEHITREEWTQIFPEE